jgi:hypothetical protein
MSELMTPEYWRERAEEARTHAEAMSDPNAKTTLLKLAESCEKVAKQADKERTPEPSAPAAEDDISVRSNRCR